MKSLVNTAGLNEDQKMVREAVLEILEATLPKEEIRRIDEVKEFPLAAYQALAESGFLGLFFEEQYGGAGASYKDLTNFMETLGYHYAGIGQAVMITTIYAGGHVSKFGSEELKARIIPGIIDGTIKMALAMSEPGTGSDVAGLKTKAVKQDGGYVLNGTKVWISGAHMADYLVVIAKTDPTAERHQGLSTFLVDAKSLGVSINPLSMLGRRTTHANEVVFEDVFVPEENRIGEEGKTWKNLMKGLAMERLGLAAISAGNCYRITEDAAEYAQQRIQFDQPISKFQVIQHKLVDMWIMAEQARQATYRVAELLDAGDAAIEETSVAKIIATENNFKVSDIGLQVFGGSGYAMEYDMQMYFRDSRVGPIGGGTNEIQKNILAKRMGL
ncbi:acyl-CoA dehydrogenase family protein [Arthrobacter caoxuetaonis]|uniref:acyl-CoA dehydrogenase family protein n=1 Tax=Arthrobacter caoxuetaonis TaxID=2886935 RepID=UPI001D13F0D3|nr:acyl-CoA dehydrogenase family protein [Arthrobacter caoxuetaonis]MCC3281984.1 acyl-CoA/acyl-ACP dehydrogenase [Arthrobacter caoxuetaonis]MCC3282977.1 acyl-CoA/acyl-ACP dehydrogenase [Arthrobacter caoxuetaonis]